MLECGPDKDCHPATCCSIPKKAIENGIKPLQTQTMDNNGGELQEVTVTTTRTSSNKNEVVSPTQVPLVTMDSAAE